VVWSQPGQIVSESLSQKSPSKQRTVVDSEFKPQDRKKKNLKQKWQLSHLLISCTLKRAAKMNR
jgi:hypothetical protein